MVRRPSSVLAQAVRIALCAAPVVTSLAVVADEAPIERIEIVGQSQKYRMDSSSTATKTNTLLRDTPQAISVVTEELAKDQAMQNMADVVRYVPGAQMAQGEGHRDAPILRGSATTGDFFINGVRDDAQYLRDLYNVKRVEVLKGPSGMIFGRGGSGGLINRVTKQADWSSGKAIDVTLSNFDQKRVTADVNHALDEQLAVRLTAMYEDSGSFRDYMDLERKGFNPTVSFQPTDATLIQFSFEHMEDKRTTDRGVPSLASKKRPLDTRRSQFFGKPEDSYSTVEADGFNLDILHEVNSHITVANHTRYAYYDKLYSNVYPNSFNETTQKVALAGYESGTYRKNLLNQTDVTFDFATAGIQHTLLAGVELNAQDTDNVRYTAYFPTATSVNVDVTNPIYTGSVVFKQSATDADNHSDASTNAAYLQDQIELSANWQALIGVRYDRFENTLTNHRNGAVLESVDNLLSPRAGLIYKPLEQVSAYVSVSKSYVPRAGDQLSSLTVANSSLDPEEFHNKEAGLKWDLSDDFSMATAVYQLDRRNVAVTDPTDSSKLVLMDGQRVKGLEVEFNGAITEQWNLLAGYAYQDSEVLNSANGAMGANAGNALPQVPKQTFSLWNRVDLNDQWGFGLGFTARSKVYTTADNLVVLPGYGRLDAAAYYTPVDAVKIQLNIENLLDKHYYASAHTNNNIMPGSPTAVRLGVSYKF